MRFVTLFLVLGMNISYAINSYSQSTELSIHVKDKTIKEVFGEIEKNSEFIFIYYDRTLDLDKKVSIQAAGENIVNILDKLFESTNIQYMISDRQIALSKKEIKLPDVAGMAEVQQGILITGTVTDEKDEPLPGVNVVIKGTNTGVVSGINGTYSLTVPDQNAVLVFSFIGYTTVELLIGDQRLIDVALEEDTREMEEVVVVGYGTQKKVNLTGSVDVISGKILSDRSAPTVAQLIQGAAPSLNISMTNLGGEPGATRTWNIRGLGSIDGSYAPLILVDGVESNPDNIDPESIESISVLKDASASAVYGSRAPFGVVLITTKRGKKNEETRIQYSNNFSFAKALNIPHFVDALTWVTAYNQVQSYSGGAAPIYPDEQVERVKAYMAGTYQWEYDIDNPPVRWARGRWDGNANYDWPGEYYNNNGFSQKHNINVEGGGEKMQFYVSAGYLDQQSLYTWGNDGYSRYNVMANLSSQVTNWLSFGINTKYSRFETDRPLGYLAQSQSYIQREFLSYGPLMPKYNVDGTINNPLIRALQDSGRERKQGNDLGITLHAELEPIEGWKTNISYSYNYGGGTNLQNPKPVWVQNPNGSLGNVGSSMTGSIEQLSTSNYNLFNALTSYERNIGKHFFKILVGYEQELSKFRGLYGSKMELITEEVVSINTALGAVTLSDAISHWSTQGVFGRLNYNFAEKYLFEFSARYNGSSKFPKHSRWGFFPSASAGYNISKENFWEPVRPYVNSLKLRASYGSLGNQNVDNYLYLSSVPVQRDMKYLIDGARPLYAEYPQLISADLTWETITTLNIGADAGFLNNRLTLSFDWYNRTTDDMFGPAEVLPTVLGTKVPLRNNAKLETKGFEIILSWRDQISSDFAYNIGINLGDSKSKVLEYNSASMDIGGWYPGKEYGEIWGFVTDGIIQTADEKIPDQTKYYAKWGPGDIKYADLNDDGILDDGKRRPDDHGDLKVIGNNSPRYNFGITAGAAWKNFDFSMFWQGLGKRDYYPHESLNKFWGIVPGGTPGSESSLFKNSRALDYWRAADDQTILGPNTDAYFPKPYFAVEVGKSRMIQTRYLLNGSYIRLKNLQLGYTLPQHLSKKVFIHRARIYISGENLLTFTNLPDTLEPETMFASDPKLNTDQLENAGAIYPIARTISFGINLTF